MGSGGSRITQVLVFIIITTRNTSWRTGHQQSSSTPVLSLASLRMVPQLWFMVFIFASTVLHQVVFGQPCFCCPSGFQWIAALASLRSMCSIQRHHFLIMMVSIFFCWHRAMRSWLEMVLGQKMRWIFPEACCVKGQLLWKVTLGHLPALWSVHFLSCISQMLTGTILKLHGVSFISCISQSWLHCVCVGGGGWGGETCMSVCVVQKSPQLLLIF